MHANQILEARALATPVGQSQAAVDTAPMMVLQYVPDCGTGGSSASCALVQNSSMTFLVDSSTPAGLDVIGTSGIILTSSSTYDTMGELVDTINGALAWRAYLVGALRSDASSILLAKSAALCSVAAGLTFYGDTSQNEGSIVPGTAAAYEIVGTAISGEKFVNNGKAGHLKDADDACENYMTYAQVEATFTGTGTLRVYSGKQGSAETLMWTKVLATTVQQELGSTGSAGIVGVANVFIQAKRGERLILRAGTTTAFTSIQQFNVTGKTAVLANNRFVDSINFTAG